MTMQDPIKIIENLARILVLDLQSRRQCYETLLSQNAERSAQVTRLLNDTSRRNAPTIIHPANNTNQTYSINEQRGTPNLSYGNAVNTKYGINSTPNRSGSSARTNTKMNSTLGTDIPSTLVDSTLYETNTVFSIHDLTSTGNGTTSTTFSTPPGTSGNSSTYTEMTPTISSSDETNSTRNPVRSTTTPFTNTNATTNSSMMSRNDQSPSSNSHYPSDSRNTARYENETTPSNSQSSRSRTIGEIRMILPYCEPSAFIECPTCHNCIHIVVDNTSQSPNVSSLPDNLSFRVRQIRGTNYSSPSRIADNFAHQDPRASTPIHMSPQTMSSFSNGGPALSTPLSHNNDDPVLNRMQISPLNSLQHYQNTNHPRITEIRRNPLPATTGQQGIHNPPIDTSSSRRFDSPTRGFDTTTRGFESTTRGFDTTTRGFDTTTQGFDTTTRGFDTTTRDPLSSIHDSGSGRHQEQTPENAARARDTIRLNDGSYNNMQECESMLAENFVALIPIFLRIVDVLAELRDYTRPINQR